MVAKRHACHPVRQQLLALRGNWDGDKHLATWLRRCCMEEDEHDDTDPLQQGLARVGTWVVMALCACVLMPGCKLSFSQFRNHEKATPATDEGRAGVYVTIISTEKETAIPCKHLISILQSAFRCSSALRPSLARRGDYQSSEGRFNFGWSGVHLTESVSTCK